MCFLSIAFVKSRGKGHGQVCPGKDGPYSSELSWSFKGYTRFVQQSNTVLVNSIETTALEEEWGISCCLPSDKNTTADQKASLLWCTLNKMGPLTAAF